MNKFLCLKRIETKERIEQINENERRKKKEEAYEIVYAIRTNCTYLLPYYTCNIN